MLLGFKTEIKVKSHQRILLAKHAGVARHAWNWGLDLTKQILDHNQENPKEKIKFPTAIDLHKWLVALVKSENQWYYEVSKCAPQYALRHLRKAWDDCFKKKKKPPRFKKKGKQDSFTLDGSITIEHAQIKVPRIGWLKTYERLPQGIKPSSVTISKRAHRWFISFKVESEAKKIAPKNNPIGIDLGLLRFASLSTGESVCSPRPYKQLEKKLAKLQWKNRNKVIGSNNCQKAQLQIAKLHYKISCIRQDFIHKLTSRLAKNHSEIVIENLNVAGMIKNKKLAKAIADSGFFEFKRQLTYKTQLYGSELVLADRFFPSSKLCPCCGNKKEQLPLSMRVYDCENCDWIADRDYSASLNLLGLVRPDVMSVETKTSVAPLMKQKLKLVQLKCLGNFIQFCLIMSKFQITVSRD